MYYLFYGFIITGRVGRRSVGSFSGRILGFFYYLFGGERSVGKIIVLEGEDLEMSEER